MDWTLAPLTLGGLLCVWLLRAAYGSAWQPWLQALFLGYLCLMGYMTAVSLRWGVAPGLVSGAMVTIVAVLAVCDIGRQPSGESFSI
jgi:hypothetical protein